MRFLTKNRSPLLRREIKLEKTGGALCDRRGWLEALLLCLWFKTNMYPKFSVEDKKNSSYSKDGAVKSQLSLFVVELLSCVCSKLFLFTFLCWILDLPSMSSLTEKDRPIVQLLLNAGTCPRCILRFCCVGSQMLYRHPHKVCPSLCSWALCLRGKGVMKNCAFSFKGKQNYIKLQNW